jgi:hypothetical protein
VRVGVQLVDPDTHEVIGFVDFDLRGKELAEFQADPAKWRRETNDFLVALMKKKEGR